ncbi:MFS transporter [Serratia marcescens]|uniref:MFS transporter n=1 Tax=Serratia marcescens TaxID=615 RepID=UPI000C13D5DA|nr:MFS transporter [Serratia marcescens]PHY73707.1 MFS transporter [Serratia marcescens]PIC09189.1 MFS transporter [Serratia marcescens]CAI2123823.1 Proline porter II [Serratia marcescens]HAT2879369.1 MFS transporter [Serratia marcescens]HAT2890406.1 MFS transporter [Serratia marcescens]
MTATSTLSAPSAGANLYASRRRVITGTTIGNALEFFDFTVFSFLMLFIGPLFFPAASAYGQLLLTTGTFGVGFLMRPIGALLIGSYSDRFGRRSAMALTLFLMGLGCAMMALAPTYKQIGMMAPLIIVLARLIQGFAAGGEVGAATTLLVEHAPPAQRGFYASWQFGSQSLGIFLGAVMVAALVAGLDQQAMSDWGWRVPFFIGMLTAPVGWYIRRHLEDTLIIGLPTQQAKQHAACRSPLRELFGQHKLTLVKSVLLMLGAMVSTQIIAFYMPAYAARVLGLPTTSSLLASVVVGISCFLLSPPVGWLADRYGRKRVIFYSRLLTLVAIVPSFQWLNAAPSLFNLLLIIGLLSMLLTLQTVPGITMLPEMFPKSIRTTGMAAAYGIGVSVFGGFAQFFVTWLLQVTGQPLAPAWYMMATVALSTLALLWIRDRTGEDIDRITSEN